MPDWMIALAHSTHGNHGTYMMQPLRDTPILAAMPRLDVVAHSARKAIEPRRSDLLVRPDNDRTDPAASFLAPAGDLMRQQHEPLIPGARKHLLTRSFRFGSFH